MAKARKKRGKKKFVFTKRRRAALRKAQAANRRKGRARNRRPVRNPESKAKRSAAAKRGARKSKARKRPSKRSSTKTVVHKHEITVRVAGAKGGKVTASERKSGTLGKKGRRRYPKSHKRSGYGA